MGTTKKKPRRAKAAGRALKAFATRQTTSGGKHVKAKPDSIDETERQFATTRAARHAETKKRNTAAQEIGEHIKRRKTGSQVGPIDTNHFDADRDAFFASIDEPLYRAGICC
ncbi:hypothetical protein PC113_g11124 [Phytophthora cactorum]|uniref:Uncharacterized protein n=1 Tax=Phytophthora cactorum TaxID=29920 RepID=A0A8T0Z3Y5_9STRA|nr:hypothetical protein PC112_g11848 [Phytophthora cactorum]KAG2856944.1 hypothetical protein PC113_g11124 [Phytophthora cactorum]KAG2907147.1 hypothetical protein PC114_g10909 [Phytophthora cactorum]KAG2914546.1 hypothetical protein PC115_g11662 [Phytophthora cactorum]KAG3160929.1 hypothetical protein C6341_g13717 [Phytophthora cactorum]